VDALYKSTFTLLYFTLREGMIGSAISIIYEARTSSGKLCTLRHRNFGGEKKSLEIRYNVM